MSLKRFLDAQDHGVWEAALAELQRGCKRGHWMWFILPQLRGLGRSANAQFYGLSGLDEAQAFLAHPVLGARLIACCDELEDWPHLGAEAVLGKIDAVKLRSCLTLFGAIPGAPLVFADLLEKYFDGIACRTTRSQLS